MSKTDSIQSPYSLLQRGSIGASSYALHRLRPWLHQYRLESLAATLRQSGQHRGGVDCALEWPGR